MFHQKITFLTRLEMELNLDDGNLGALKLWISSTFLCCRLKLSLQLLLQMCDICDGVAMS